MPIPSNILNPIGHALTYTNKCMTLKPVKQINKIGEMKSSTKIIETYV